MQTFFCSLYWGLVFTGIIFYRYIWNTKTERIEIDCVNMKATLSFHPCSRQESWIASVVNLSVADRVLDATILLLYKFISMKADPFT